MKLGSVQHSSAELIDKWPKFNLTLKNLYVF